MPAKANTKSKLQTTPANILVWAEAQQMLPFPVCPHLSGAAPSRFWARWQSGHSYSCPLSGCSNGWFVCTIPGDTGCWAGGPCSHWSSSPQMPNTWWAQGSRKMTKAQGKRDTEKRRWLSSLIGIEGVASFRTEALIILVTPTDDSRFTIKTCLKTQKHPKEQDYLTWYKYCEVRSKFSDTQTTRIRTTTLARFLW